MCCEPARVTGMANWKDRSQSGVREGFAKQFRLMRKSASRRGVAGYGLLGSWHCGRNSMVECQPSKLNVEGSSPFARFDASSRIASLSKDFFRGLRSPEGFFW